MSEFDANQYLIFQVDEEYAVELDKVHEIIELGTVTRVPETPPYVAGVINLRGNVIPVIDMRERFRKPPTSESKRLSVVVVDFDNMKLGLIVDQVLDLVTIEPENVNPPPQVGDNYAHVFIKAIGLYQQKMKLIIDSEKIINHDDLDKLAN